VAAADIHRDKFNLTRRLNYRPMLTGVKGLLSSYDIPKISFF